MGQVEAVRGVVARGSENTVSARPPGPGPGPNTAGHRTRLLSPLGRRYRAIVTPPQIADRTSSWTVPALASGAPPPRPHRPGVIRQSERCSAQRFRSLCPVAEAALPIRAEIIAAGGGRPGSKPEEDRQFHLLVPRLRLPTTP